MRIDVWSDVVCPWCYIGKRRLETAIEGLDVQVVWHSFELDPRTAKFSDLSLLQTLASKYRLSPERAQAMQAHVTKVAAAEGLDFHLERARPENTFDAHRFLHWAATQGKGPEAKERLLRAYFVDGQRVGDPTTLAALAADVGIDPTDAAQVLADPRAFADAVRADEAQAHQIGVQGIPFFVIDGRYGVSGAQEASLLRRAIEQAAAERAPDPTAGPACDDDSCVPAADEA